MRPLFCWLFHSSYWHTHGQDRFCLLCGRSWPIPLDPVLKARLREIARLKASWREQSAIRAERLAREHEALREWLRRSTVTLEAESAGKVRQHGPRKN